MTPPYSVWISGNNYHRTALTSCLCKWKGWLMILSSGIWRLTIISEISSVVSGKVRVLYIITSTLKCMCMVPLLKKNMQCQCFFFCLEKAYDLTRKYGILKDLDQFGLGGICPFLFKTFYLIGILESGSGLHRQELSVPQGSLICYSF